MVKMASYIALGLQILIIITAAFLLNYPQVGINCTGLTCAKLSNLPYILGILLMVYGVLGMASLLLSELEIKKKKPEEEEGLVG